MKSTKKKSGPGGIAHHKRPDGGPIKGLDEIFPSSDYPVTGTTDGGGPLWTNVEVAVIFWGDGWTNASPALNVSPDDYYTVFTGIVTGPYMTRLNQYRGLSVGTMLGKFMVPSSTTGGVTMPVTGYQDSDVENMLTTFFQDNTSVAPVSGHNRFYAVILPPDVDNALSADGQHQFFTNSANGANCVYAWVDSTDSLTDKWGAAKVFGHELVEGCSNPTLRGSDAGNGIKATGSGIEDGDDEIGDACESSSNDTLWVNKLECQLQGYWSQSDNACVLPLGTVTLLMNKSTFGKDEVQEQANKAGLGFNAVFSNAFWVALDEYSQTTYASFGISIPMPTFTDLGGNPVTIQGLSIQLTPATAAAPNPVYENPGDSTTIQRIRYSYDVVFTTPLTTSFPGQYLLNATFLMNGNQPPGGTQGHSQDVVNFDLEAGEDPYFLNIDPEDGLAVSYLSQDLRVCNVTPGQSVLPGDPNAPVFTSGESPYTYIQGLLAYLNNSTAYTTPVPPTSSDPLNGLTNQSGYETGLTSVIAQDSSGDPFYNFAIARVRMMSDNQGSAGEASDTRVFFRLWTAPSYDTDYNPNTTYPSTPDGAGFPGVPLPSGSLTDPSGNSLQTTPFFATSGGGSDFDPSFNTSTRNNNIQTIEIPTVPGRDSVWTYYGCFLDVYDSGNNAKYPGTHHCLVAQIAYDDAPIPYSTSTTTTTGNCDKLSQRNLQITKSGNPGPASTHRVPQAFDTRPSLPFLSAGGKMTGLPDEIMIDWGNTPAGSTAYVYWPQVLASDVLDLASRMYYTHLLSSADAHTIVCKTVKGVTYIPIPTASDINFAGLITIDLPIGVRSGELFKVVVRRLTTKMPPNQNKTYDALRKSRIYPGRVVTGAFQITIPVTTEENMLPSDENTLAIMKWRFQNMTPAYRWYPVVSRYIDYLSARINGSGGNAASIPPLEYGIPVYTGGNPPRPGKEKCCTGKVREVVFDCFGEFEGFIIDCCCSSACSYRSREKAIGELVLKACQQRWTVSVCADNGRICEIKVLA